MSTQEELLKRIHDLESEVKYLNDQIKRQPYGLTWLDVPEAFEAESKNKIPILEEVPELAICHDDGKPTHILIEGDNYHALKCLNYTHKGKVDVIYIDPPYNTGKDGFTYKDERFLKEYPDGEKIPVNHPLRHSAWLSFMYKRLIMAKELLNDNGLIFISIGDDEVGNLKLLCERVFGEQQYIETYVWNSIARPDNSSPILRRNAEFILCCAKDYTKITEFNGVISETSGMPSLTKAKEALKEINFPACCVKTTLKDGIYKAGVKENGKNPKWELLNDVTVKDGLIQEELSLKGHSYWSTAKKIKEELDAGTEIWIKSESFVPYYKKKKDSVNRPAKILPIEYVREGIYANTELNKEIFHSKVFSNPKPTTLISFLVNFLKKRDCVILDFFAGSGTTLDAVMKLNDRDGGKRECLLVQAKEPTFEIVDGKEVALSKGSDNAFEMGFRYISDIAYERNKRVMNGYTDSKGNMVAGLGNSLKYYRTAFIGKHQAQEATDEDRIILSQKAGCLLALAEDTLEETMKNDFFQIYTDSRKQYTAIYFQENYSHYGEFLHEVERLDRSVVVYIFSFGTAEEFLPDYEGMKNVELKAIPQPILDIYKSLNR